MRTFIAAMALGLAALPAYGHGPNDPPHQLHPLGDFKLESGESIRDFSISYVTHGTLNAKKSNAVGSGDLLNPEADAQEAANYIPDVRYIPLNATRPMGHLSGAGVTAPEIELQNAEIAGFLDIVTDRGRKLQ